MSDMEGFRLDQKLYHEKLAKMALYNERGKLAKSVGLTFEAYLPGASVGSIVRMVPSHYHELLSSNRRHMKIGIEAEVIGFKDKRVILMPLEDARGLSNTSRVMLADGEASIPVGDFLLGRVVDGRGEPIDDKGPIAKMLKNIEKRGIYGVPVNPLDRATISQPLDLGIRAINGLITCGKGQRMGIMAGSGVRKKRSSRHDGRKYEGRCQCDRVGRRAWSRSP